MKIAIIGDTHFGYTRFEQDSFVQAELAISDACKKSDLIIIAGDIFDTKIPKMETLEKVISILKNAEKPIVAIHGNHERRGKDMINALKLLDSAEVLNYIHNESKIFTINSEQINIIGLGNVPSEYAKVALERAVIKNPRKEGIFNLMVLHQTINELGIGEEEISIEDIKSLPYELIVNGHIHKKHLKLDSKLIIPGSTVITQLKEDETEKRGYFIFDTITKKAEFTEIDSREFEIIRIDFNGEGIKEAEEKIKNAVKNHSDNKITKIILSGNLKEGMSIREISLPNEKNLFIENKTDSKSLREKINLIRKSGQEQATLFEDAIGQIKNKTAGKISFDSDEFFEKLVEGVEESEKYLDRIKKF
ncbi:MAG: DNA repair exonuclease [Candidatus Micrarchaeia archaeon]|jgi:DNA repair exonuclease SbcCD nuclease subunit